MWSHMLNLFQEYMGSGLIVIWFLISLIYLWITEKRKPIRILFLYVPLILLLLFFNPVFAKLVFEAAGDEIYYRILWLLPITVVIAFATVEIWKRLEGRRKSCFLVASVAIIVISGKYVYSNEYFQKAENLYHIPQTVVDICDAIEVEGREVKAIFPLEMVQYVRQYSPVICMPYGREIIVESWQFWNPLYDVMEADVIDPGLLASGCREQWTAYIILPKDKPVNGSLTDYDFEVFAEIDEYVIYKDATVDLTVG